MRKRSTKKLIQKLLQKLKIRASSAKNRWIFLTRCVHHKVLPPSLKPRPVLKTRRGRDITFKYDLKMLQATAAEAKKSFHKLNSEIKLLSRELSIELAVDDHNVVTRSPVMSLSLGLTRP